MWWSAVLGGWRGGSLVGIQALHIRPKIVHSHPSGTLHMHQRQQAGGDQALDGAHRNTQLLGGFALGDQQSPGHSRRIECGPSGVKDWHILTFPDTSCRPESGHRRLQIPRPSPQIAPRDDGWAGYVAVAATGRCWLRWSKPRASVRLWMTAGCCRRVVTDWMTPSRKDNYGIMVEMCLLPRRAAEGSAWVASHFVRRPFPIGGAKGIRPLTFSLRRLRRGDGTTLEGAADGAWRA